MRKFSLCKEIIKADQWIAPLNDIAKVNAFHWKTEKLTEITQEETLLSFEYVCPFITIITQIIFKTFVIVAIASPVPDLMAAP